MRKAALAGRWNVRKGAACLLKYDRTFWERGLLGRGWDIKVIIYF